MVARRRLDACGRWKQAVSGIHEHLAKLGSSIIDVTGQGLRATSGDAKPREQTGVKNGQLDTKRGDDFVENCEDRGKFYSTYVNKESCSGLAASGRRRSCPSSHGRCCPSPAGKNLPQHFPNYYFYNSGHIAIFTEYTTIDFLEMLDSLYMHTMLHR